MKTVMKKMLCLMLVAVLMVGVMPFQAFADGTSTLTVLRNDKSYKTGSLDTGVPYTVAGLAEQYADGAYDAANTQLHVKDSSGNPAGYYGVNDSFTLDPAHTSVTLYIFGPNCTNCNGEHEIGACPTYCNTCTMSGHNEDSDHCTGCGYYTGHADNCPTQKCATCGQDKHDVSVPCCATCKKTGHSTDDPHCTTCNMIGHNTSDAHCTGCGYYTGHADNCSKRLCDKNCGATVHTGPCCSACNKDGHQRSACPDLYETCCNVAKGSEHRADCVTRCTKAYNCTNANHKDGCKYALCNTEGCTELESVAHTEHPGVRCNANNQCTFNLGHSTKHSYQCQTSGCDYAINHTGLCSNEHEYEAGDSDLEIWVNLHTANVETKTRLLVTYENLSEDTLVHEFISDRRDEIDEMLVDYYGKDYEWSGHIYDGTNTNKSIKTTRTLGEGTSVYINAYTYQDLVYVYVHDSRSYSNIRVILFEGKQVGDTISRSEVADVVGDYYNLSSLKMYSEDDWKKIVQGKSVDSRKDLTVTDEPYHIDVLISGSSKTGSGYTADSTNPKTGDMIFAPAIVMGASVTALAVLFFLNKKRAIV